MLMPRRLQIEEIFLPKVPFFRRRFWFFFEKKTRTLGRVHTNFAYAALLDGRLARRGVRSGASTASATQQR
jgi:hypothetical protein